MGRLKLYLVWQVEGNYQAQIIPSTIRDRQKLHALFNIPRRTNTYAIDANSANEAIEQVREIWERPDGLAKGEFTTPEDFDQNTFEIKEN